MGKPYFARLKEKWSRQSYHKRQENQQYLDYEVDRILDKVHQHGIHSLTRKEKQILQKATEQHK